MKPIQPHIDVSCAIIEKHGLILAAQRGEAMNMPLKWEFPGGKVGPRESTATCLQQEIRDEPGVETRILTALAASELLIPRYAEQIEAEISRFC